MFSSSSSLSITSACMDIATLRFACLTDLFSSFNCILYLPSRIPTLSLITSLQYFISSFLVNVSACSFYITFIASLSKCVVILIYVMLYCPRIKYLIFFWLLPKLFHQDMPSSFSKDRIFTLDIFIRFSSLYTVYILLIVYMYVLVLFYK